MEKYDVSAAFVMEQTAFTDNIKITKVVDRPGMHYIRFPCRIQTYNTWNRNNRNYWLQPMKVSWNAPHIQELERNGDFMGEAGHPNSEDPKRIVTIDPKYVCHRITDHWFQGDSVYGNFETLNDEMYGKQFMMHVLQKCNASVSLRALVPLTKVGKKRHEIRSPGHIICVDRIILPSHPDAYQVPGTIEMFTSESTTFGSQKNMEDNQINTDKLVKVTESSFLNYLAETDKNISSFIDEFEVTAESMSLDPSGKHMILKEPMDKDGNRRTAYVKLDSYIRNEVSHLFRNL